MDLDGTLIHSGTFLVHLEFIGRILPILKKHQGWRAGWTALSESFNLIKTPSADKTNHVRIINTFEKHLKMTFEEAEKNLVGTLTEVFPKLKSHFGVIEGAAEFVEWAKPRYSLTLATNPVWLIDLVHMRMRWGGVNPDDFKSITTADRMHALKPKREYFDELLEQEKFNPKDCLFIGNDPKMDLPANAAGIPVFLIKPDAKHLSCLIPPSDQNPGAWRGNYQHLKKLLHGQPTP
jgi:FMN phosphatase YigB (HAD superfamily)